MQWLFLKKVIKNNKISWIECAGVRFFALKLVKILTDLFYKFSRPNPSKDIRDLSKNSDSPHPNLGLVLSRKIT